MEINEEILLNIPSIFIKLLELKFKDELILIITSHKNPYTWNFWNIEIININFCQSSSTTEYAF